LDLGEELTYYIASYGTREVMIEFWILLERLTAFWVSVDV
jgi:hypothetical protein